MKALENAGSSEPSYDVEYVSGGTNVDADAHTGLIFKKRGIRACCFCRGYFRNHR